jgi:endogenous inhibitor of DNA gyrase (YacG/DUF329 family)
MKHKCPVCKKIIKASAREQTEGAKFFPFCSQRCKLIDLGAWLDAKYKIISEFKSRESTESSDTSDTSLDGPADKE